MTRLQVTKLIGRLRMRNVLEDVHGFVLRRAGTVNNSAPAGADRWYRSAYATASFAVWREERWRLEPGGGIAGNSGQWWLAPCAAAGAFAPIMNVTPPAPAALGPFTTCKALEAALRQWRRWDLP